MEFVVITKNLTEKGSQMKTFRQLLGILLLVVASAGLVVACGDEAEECLDDNDCAAEDACNFETGECAFKCSGDGDCLDDEVCTTRDDGEGICVFDDTGNGGGGCQSDDDCPADGELCDFFSGECAQECASGDECPTGFACFERDGEDGNVCAPDACDSNDDCTDNQFCNDDGLCEDEAQQYNFLRIEDVSDPSSDAACVNPSDDDPGSDLYGVLLEKDDGSQYWAEVHYDGIVTDGNLKTDTSRIDGTPPGLDADECPDVGFDDGVVALGCGGELIVGFWDSDNDDWVPLENLDSVTVFEYGPACNGHDEDEWQVFVCTTGEDEALTGQCDGFSAGDASTGINSVTISLD
jgi:hypothetical protein